MVGTASRFRSWLLVEQPGRWGHDALTESGFPAAVGADLAALGRRLGMRVLLVKRRERPWPSARRRCFVAYTGVRERRVGAFEVEDPAELLDLDLPGWVGGRFAGVGEPVSGPLFLVCTHGKHDPCCARLGGPLSRALTGVGGGVWESTHVGGDRFAGNLVCFPHGLYFGRVGAADARRVAGAYTEGRIELDHYRGRSCYSPPVQAAEHHVRTDLGLDGVDDLPLLDHRVARSGRHRATFGLPDGSDRVVEITVRMDAERLLTCKAVHPHPSRRFEVRPG
jgi:hypothetical protein